MLNGVKCFNFINFSLFMKWMILVDLSAAVTSLQTHTVIFEYAFVLCYPMFYLGFCIYIHKIIGSITFCSLLSFPSFGIWITPSSWNESMYETVCLLLSTGLQCSLALSSIFFSQTLLFAHFLLICLQGNGLFFHHPWSAFKLIQWIFSFELIC